MSISQSQEQICKMLRSHFNSLRQRQKQNRDVSSKITDDVKFVLKFVSDSVRYPAPILRAMGMILFKDCIAFNLNVLFIQLAITRRNSILPSLHREGWKDVDKKVGQQLEELVGANEMKNWYVLEYPLDTEIHRDILENPGLMATGESLAEDKEGEQEDSGEVSFPLVSIQYERVFEDFLVADFEPLEVATKKRKMEIVKCEYMEFRVPESK